ncbi:NADH:flavin oxidoreductase [[Clostridium] polysaccharolyticum]|nr:NADH:flavin oxidoreductase [[Clostridium] polysaccharolyticum]
MPCMVNAMKVKNRIVMPAVYIGNKFYHEKFQNFYISRAAKDVGMIIVPIPTMNGVADLCCEEFIQTSKRFVAKCHQYDCKLIAQIFSGVGEMVNEFTKEELEQISQDLILSAKKVKEAGYDGIEIHGAHHALFMSLLSPKANLRTDEFGGKFENRVKLALRTVKGIREVIGKEYPLMFRFSGTEFCEGGVDIKMSIRYAKLLQEEGVDCIDVSAGGSICSPKNSECPDQTKEEGCFSDIFSAIKKEVSVPVIGSGKIITKKTADKILEAGEADFVGVGRPLVASADWARRMLKGNDGDKSCIETWYEQLPKWN